jgi:hypothetical protein
MSDQDRIRRLMLAQEQQRRAANVNAPQAVGDAVVTHTTRDGGRIMQMPDGTQSFVSPGMSTSNPVRIAKIMEGATPAEASRAGMQEEYIQSRPVASRAATAVSGVPFIGSYADEAVGAVFGDPARDEMRFAQEAMQETRPVQSMGLQVAGGLAAAAPLAIAGSGSQVAQALMSRAPQSLAGKTIAGALAGGGLGATEGAIYGYGMGDEGDRGQSAMQQAEFGGGVGAAIGAVSPALGRGIRGIAGRLLNNPERAAGAALGVSPEVARVARSLVGQEPMAAANVARGGQNAMLADAGPAAQGMLDAALQVPGPGQAAGMRAIEGRAAQAGQNINQALDQVMGAPQGVQTSRDAIRDASRPQVNQAYEQAYSTPIDYAAPEGRAIEEIIGRIPASKIQKAIADATDRMIYDGAPSPQIMATIGDDGKVTFQQMPNVMQLDYIKRAFDQIARDGTDPITQRMSSDAAFAARIARDLRGAVSDAVPSYRGALSQAADSMGQQAAVDFGATLLRPQVTREVARGRIEDMTEAELRAARQGVRSQIDDALANVRAVASDQNVDARQATQAFRDLSSPSARQKLRDLLGDEADFLFSELDEAGQALGLRAAVASNSRTAARQQGNEMIDQLSDVNPLRRAASNPVRAYRETMDEIMGIGPEAMTERAQAVRAELIDLLTRSGNADAQRALTILQDVNIGQPIAEAQAKLVADAAMKAIGISGYQSSVQAGGR